MRLLALLFAYALVSGILSADAASYASVCGISEFDNGTDAAEFIGIAFMLTALLIAGAFMYSKIREEPSAGAWAKDEAANLLISVLLFAGLVAFFSGSCAVAESYAGKSPFDAADHYLAKLINSDGLGVLRQLTYASLDNQFEATKYRYIGISPFSGSGVAEYANRRAASANKEFLIDLYLPMVASLEAQRQVLSAIAWIGASVLLPFAFIMRLVPFTRDFGNVLIALFFALYIVVPTMYAMSGNAFEKIVASPICVDCAVNNFYSYGIDGGANPENGGAASALTWQNAMLYKVGSTIPQAIFIPNLVIIVAVTCVMSLSKALRALAV